MIPIIHPKKKARGAALVIVLAALVLMAALVVAFFASVSTERTAAKSSSQNNDARKLADSVLNMVVAQIKDGTNGTDSTGLPAAWISQPGLIRTFTNSGNAASAFKLYSCTNLRDDSGTFDPSAGDQPPSNWYSQPALYTDLNAPVYVPDPAGSVVLPSGTYSANYQILDPAAASGSNSIGVKGFSITGAPVEAGTTNANPNSAPMPVQWLYVLQNGDIVPATAGANPNTTATLSGTSASASNPIIGRIAFWTDDDTCKININTAAGDLWSGGTDSGTRPGSYCDAPYLPADSPFRTNQPVQHEYQRYPGHPATTYLSAVFPNLWTQATDRNKIYDLVPKVTYTATTSGSTDVSSQGGSVNTLSGTQNIVSSDGDHLYGSVDELQFAVAHSSLTGTSRPLSPVTTGSTILPSQVQQAKFFLTAQSRAPDLNLFGKPRVGMWPEIVDTNGKLTGTTFDKTIAFCSTISTGANAKAYYFVRNNPSSPTGDYQNYPRNQQLYQYLQNLTSQSIPSFGGNFNAKYGNDRDQILTEIFDYIRGSINLIDNSGTSPYAGQKTTLNARVNPAGTAQVIPIQISGPSITGTTMGFGHSQTIYTPILEFVSLNTTVVNGTSGVAIASGTNVSGANAKNYKLITSSVQAVLLIDSFCVGQGVTREVPNLVYEVTGLNNLTLNGINLGFPSDAAVSFNAFTPNNDYASGAFCGAGCLFFDTAAPYTAKTLGTSTMGSISGTSYPFYGQPISLPNITFPSTPGAEFKTPLPLSGGSGITLKIYAKTDLSTPIQTIDLNFPDTNVPTPCIPGAYNANTPTLTSGTTAKFSRNADSCMTSQNANAAGGTSSFNDVTRSLVPMGSNVRGDLRLIAAKAHVSGTSFVGADGYYAQSGTLAINSTNKWAYDYGANAWWPPPVSRKDEQTDGMLAGADRNNAGGGWAGYPGNLVLSATYNIHPVGSTYASCPYGTTAFYPDSTKMKMPDGTVMQNAAMLQGSDRSYQPGDWDNGIGGFLDGPYINKADEGEVGPSAYSSYNADMAIGTIFSPNRQIPSPVIFGSLSSGVARDLPWQTLLFCPNPPAQNLHPGWGSPAGPSSYPPYTTPPDHLLLDLFTMPVVEPYAISEPFSTAGKINMNYQIAPFSYIKRNTGLQAILRSTRVIAIPTGDGMLYKNGIATNPNSYRLNVDIDNTLTGFDQRFAANQPFRSPSEICQMFLVPQGIDPATGSTISGLTPSSMASWWNSYQLTGDNLRERPYAQIYSRLTTKSNSYTVHVRVQALKKSPAGNQNEWVEGRDQIVGEYRGSFAIERFIDPNDPDIPAKFDENYFGADQTDNTGTITKTGRLDPFYRLRVVSTKQFAP